MPAETPRIAELRRRIQADPSSIAFAQLAEEYRRIGNVEEAVRVSRTGLARHPGYLSARVTLGRALMELGQLDEAEREFDIVVSTAVDNLAAIRGMAEIYHRKGDLQVALGYYQAALGLARNDPDLQDTVDEIMRTLDQQGSAREEPAAGGGLPPMPDVSADASSFGEEPSAPAGDRRRASTGAEANPLFDFDDLLDAMGQPDARPPRHVEALLDGPGSPTSAFDPQPEVIGAGPGGETPRPEHLDNLARIEEDLRRFEARGPSGAPDHPSAPRLTLAEQATVDELEAWLRVIAAARSAARPSP